MIHEWWQTQSIAFPVRLFKAIIKSMADNQTAALISGIYILVLILILLVDLKQRRILNAIALPATLLALAVGLIDGRESFLVTLLGALAGFLFFYLLYWVGGKFYGRGALGFGDVKLAMLLGAMLRLQYVWPALLLGLLLAGLTSILLLLTGRACLRTSLPYGSFLAGAGIIVLVWATV
jgi:leader peptidase (prepilin peptidase)/N-methyltransferase